MKIKNLRLPVISAPLFIISNPELVIAQCRAGVVGSFPALNARPKDQLEVWIQTIQKALNEPNPNGKYSPAPFAINQIVHSSNDRMAHDVDLCVKYKVPIVITSLGCKTWVIDAIHSYGGVVLHDVINNRFAKKAIEKGVDGLIAVAAGAGGHAGSTSPFALIQEIREWFDGPLILSGAIASGASILASQAMGADLAYIGSAFIATHEANAVEAYKQSLVDHSSEDIVYTNLFTGVHSNYLKNSIINAGLDPDSLPESDPTAMNFATINQSEAKAWKDIWGSGQGIGAVKSIDSTAGLVERLLSEYKVAQMDCETKYGDYVE